MDLSAVAKRVYEARKAKNLTQEELAAKADISATHISVLERCVKLPNLDTFIAIANALDVSADYLLQDVVKRSIPVQYSELSELLENQPVDVQKRINRALKAFLED
jgi:transcriptional regulator with XRE-family HTH domain